MDERIIARISAIAPGEPHRFNPSYEHRERVAVTAVLDYALAEAEDGDAMPIPPEAIAHAQSAARNGVRMDTISRRYTAVGQLLEDHITQEAERFSLSPCNPALRAVRWAIAALLDRLIVSIHDEYTIEALRCRKSPEQQLADHMRDLLAGDRAATFALDYEFDAWHLGAIVTGTLAANLIDNLAAHVGCRVLFVTCESNMVWAWFSGPRRRSLYAIERAFLSAVQPGATLALGESAEGLDGWRLTHWQAQDAHFVSLRQPQRLTRYVDVALVVSWLRDIARARWLIDTYLAPLDGVGRSGETLRKTLRAYFAVGRNQAAAERQLNISRRTMRNRMAIIEDRLGPLLHACQAEIELALRLDAIINRTAQDRARSVIPTGRLPRTRTRVRRLARQPAYCLLW
jgi:PucR C-terminal helix-turn-helix domain